MQHDTLTCRHSLIVALSLSLFPSLSLSLLLPLSLSLTLFFERARVSLHPLPPPFCHPTLIPLCAAYRRKGPLISIFKFQKDSLLSPSPSLLLSPPFPFFFLFFSPRPHFCPARTFTFTLSYSFYLPYTFAPPIERVLCLQVSPPCPEIWTVRIHIRP